MPYSNFKKMQQVVTKFGLSIQRHELFGANIAPVEPSQVLLAVLERGKKIGFTSEKERSERLVSPVLTEVVELNNYQITLYSGHELEVDAENGLKGECDYLMSLGSKALEVIEAPIFSVVEAKKEDMEYGTAQSIAQSIGIQRFNAQRGIFFPYTYGCATDGLQWRFFKLTDKIVHLDTKTYLLSELSQILGIFLFIFEDCKHFEPN